MDKRTREAQLICQVRHELSEHCGPAPSATQRALVERAAVLTLFVTQFDQRAFAEGGLSEHDARQYLAYSNSLSRTLRHLGLRAASAREPDPLAALHAHLKHHDEAAA